MLLKVTKGRCLTVLDANAVNKGSVWRCLIIFDEEAATAVDGCGDDGMKSCGYAS
jgi:hypothetical protein